MKLSRAKVIADKYIELLQPLCKRIEIAGSMRRQREEVGDIELVCIPKTTTIEDGLFGEKEVRDFAFVNFIATLPRVKGNGEGKYTQIMIGNGDHIDLFMTTPEQWGIIFMIRTGSAAFSKRVVNEIKNNGYKCEEGYLKKLSGEVIPCYEEEDFFRITGTPYLEPSSRIL